MEICFTLQTGRLPMGYSSEIFEARDLHQPAWIPEIFLKYRQSHCFPPADMDFFWTTAELPGSSHSLHGNIGLATCLFVHPPPASSLTVWIAYGIITYHIYIYIDSIITPSNSRCPLDVGPNYFTPGTHQASIATQKWVGQRMFFVWSKVV